jgi:hypothetical protein
MEKFSQHLTYSLLSSLAGLPVGCAVGGLLLGLYSFFTESAQLAHIPELFGLGLFITLVAIFLGIIPTFLYGAPLYALLSKYGWANWLTVIVMGVIPGAIVLLQEPKIGGLLLMFGPCVAVSTHLFAKHRLAK